jgi:hypothetical protein
MNAGEKRSSMAHAQTLKALRLPPILLSLIKSGQLIEEIERIERLTAVLNDQLDAWEAANPEKAVELPWFEARQQWKADGRPAADWWELLMMWTVKPITACDVVYNVFKHDEHERYARYRADPVAWERYRSHRRAADSRYQARRKAKLKASAAA